MGLTLQQYFPMIRKRQEVMTDIEASPRLSAIFYGWTAEAQKEFWNFYTEQRL
jgi:hypothetical protein